MQGKITFNKSICKEYGLLNCGFLLKTLSSALTFRMLVFFLSLEMSMEKFEFIYSYVRNWYLSFEGCRLKTTTYFLILSIIPLVEYPSRKLMVFILPPFARTISAPTISSGL